MSGFVSHGPLDAELVQRCARAVAGGVAFVCGSNGSVGSASALLLGAGLGPEQIRTERSGLTG